MLKALSSLFAGKPSNSSAAALYGAVVAQARQPAFYRELGVPDTLDGRFDLLVLHAFLVLRRLNGLGSEGQAVAQALSDLVFADMDGNLREIGVGDLSVGKKIKVMAKAFFGRLTAYEAAVNATGDELTEALRRNLYGTVAHPEAAHLARLAAYTRVADQNLAGQGADTLLVGQVNFPPAA
jgi:cytochrome b pre-mRNA-processing protein 3